MIIPGVFPLHCTSLEQRPIVNCDHLPILLLISGTPATRPSQRFGHKVPSFSLLVRCSCMAYCRSCFGESVIVATALKVFPGVAKNILIGSHRSKVSSCMPRLITARESTAAPPPVAVVAPSGAATIGTTLLRSAAFHCWGATRAPLARDGGSGSPSPPHANARPYLDRRMLRQP